MYKLLLCWRYLKTRFLAMICIVSVMLGVATLVVVNSVMSGFSTKLKDRLHGLLSDVVIEANNYNGLPLSDEEMLRRIRESPAGPHIEAMTPTIEVVAMLNFNARLQGGKDDGFLAHTPTQPVTRPLHLMGVDPKGRSAIKGFAEYLGSEERRLNPSFDLTQDAKDRFERNYPLGRDPMWQAGAANAPALIPIQIPDVPEQKPDEAGPPPPDPVPSEKRDPKGIIIGHAIASYQDASTPPKDIYVLLPGDKVSILTVGVGKDHIEPVYGDLVVCDYIKTEMAEYDGNYVFVPLEYLQQLRGTPGRSTQIQIKLKDYAQAPIVVQELSKLFSQYPYNCSVETWEAKQGPLLAAIAIESRILNVLLFMITGVAGFGILAIFSMIVVEKTRDIGILKSLGASNYGVMSIFLTYGLLLGLVGATLGTIAGLLITENINVIEHWLSQATGQEIFPRKIYYFEQIPINTSAWNVVLINLGAIAIAVVFSILPAFRAAFIHPVRALRYE